MIVALTGTPGTGKTTVSKQLQTEGYTVLALNEMAKEHNLLLDYDKERDTYEVNIDGLNKHIKEQLKTIEYDTIFLEGHVSHLLELSELVIILRCHPNVLKKRLSAKSWSENKILENLEAEAVDSITIECVNNYKQDKIFEVDTTSESPKEIVQRIVAIVKCEVDSNEYLPGRIDWSEEILKWY